MKKNFSLVLVPVLIFASVLCGCSNKGTEHVGVINDNADMWVIPSQSIAYTYSYCVTDMDQNGRPELIASCNGGINNHTVSDYYEVSEDGKSLEKCEHITGGTSEADMDVDGGVCYYDKEADICYYVFKNYEYISVRETYNHKVAISLSNGKVTETVIATEAKIYEGESETPTITYTDANGNVITEQEFENIADIHFESLQKKSVSFGFKGFSDADNSRIISMSESERLNFLLKSFEKFDISKLK